MELEVAHLLRPIPGARQTKNVNSNRAADSASRVTVKRWPHRRSPVKSHFQVHRNVRRLFPRCSAIDIADVREPAFKDEVDFMKGGGSELEFVRMQAVKDLRQPRIVDKVREDHLGNPHEW